MLTRQRLKTRSTRLESMLLLPTCLLRRYSLNFGNTRLATRKITATPVAEAKMANQNQRKMNIFSFKMLTGSIHIAS